MELQANRFPELEDVLKALNDDEASCSVGVSWEPVQLYELTPPDFLSFAKQDLEEGSGRGRLNGISNARRAIACRVDEILTLTGFRSFMSRDRWGLPYKLEVIKKLGCSAPPVLRQYIASRRNEMEHEYRRPPDEEGVRYVADIAELFLKATDEYVARGRMRSVTVVVKEQEERQAERWRETVVVYKGVLSLYFDLERDELKLTSSRSAETTVHNLRNHSVSVQEKCLSEPITRTLGLADCDKRELVDLVRIVWERSRR